jgi:hypothetical protein
MPMHSRQSLRSWTRHLLPTAGPCAQQAAWEFVRALLVDFTTNRSQLARQTDRAASAKASRQFFSRWLARPHCQPEELYAHLNRLARRLLARQLRGSGDVVLMIDVTYLGKIWAVLQVSLGWQGRALPLYRAVVHAKEPEEGQTALLKQACHWLQAQLPGPQSRYVLVLDRGFPSHDLNRFWQEHGWRFVVRADNRFKMTHPEYRGSFREAVAVPGLIGPQPRLFRAVELGRRRKGLKSRIHWSVVQVVFYHGVGHKEPWFLLTSEADAARAVALYRQRMQIEGEFRDLKGPWGLDELERWQAREAVARFLAWVAVYEWRLAYLWLVHRLQEWGVALRVYGRLSWMTITRAWLAQRWRRSTRRAHACL